MLLNNSVLRYFVELSYLGKNYHGWQIQPNAISVQEMVNKAFSTILKTTINVTAAGRTDTGVHAAQMFVHLDSDLDLKNPQYGYKINSLLPDDIVVHKIFPVNSQAHARFSALARSYEYTICLGRNPFNLDTSWQLFHKHPDIKAMNEAAALLKEHTNFQCFSRSKTDVKTYNCTITHAEWILEGNILTFHITADRFLRNMVRAIVGTLIEIGFGKSDLQQLAKIIKSKNRALAGTSAPAKGLSLTAIKYPESIQYE